MSIVFFFFSNFERPNRECSLSSGAVSFYTWTFTVQYMYLQISSWQSCRGRGEDYFIYLFFYNLFLITATT